MGKGKIIAIIAIGLLLVFIGLSITLSGGDSGQSQNAPAGDKTSQWATRATPLFAKLSELYTRTGIDANTGDKEKTLVDLNNDQAFLLSDEFNNLIDTAPPTIHSDLFKCALDLNAAAIDMQTGLTDDNSARLATATQEISTATQEMQQVVTDMQQLER